MCECLNENLEPTKFNNAELAITDNLTQVNYWIYLLKEKGYKPGRFGAGLWRLNHEGPYNLHINKSKMEFTLGYC